MPEPIYAGWSARESGAGLRAEWQGRLDAYRAAHPERAAELERRMRGELPADWPATADALIGAALEGAASVASRKASQMTLDAIGPALPELLGGSADLTGSNLTRWSGAEPVTRAEGGRYVFFGVREFAMAAVCNGIALHGGFIPFAGTFLIFSDYARNAVRMAALMRQRVVFVLTHDSVGLGEDGPTHQPIEQAASLRLIPNMALWRPCDAVESAVAWRAAVERSDGPTCLLFSRQTLPHQPREAAQVEAIARGGYVLLDGGEAPAVILIATGSEVSLAVAAAGALGERGVAARVVSMPSTSVFDAQDEAYRESVLPRAVRARVAVEAGVSEGWYRYVGADGVVVGIDSFGESAPAPEVFAHFGLDAEHVVTAAERAIAAAS